MPKRIQPLAIRAWAVVHKDNEMMLIASGQLPLFWRRDPCKRFIEEVGDPDLKMIRVEIWKVAR